jgi:histone acetyltransferase
MSNKTFPAGLFNKDFQQQETQSEINGQVGGGEIKAKELKVRESIEMMEIDSGPIQPTTPSGSAASALDMSIIAQEQRQQPQPSPSKENQQQNNQNQPKRGQLAREEEEKGIISFVPVSNDGKRESMIILTGLKNIYQKQLPKMPREYIARLVYDRKHASMAIVKRNLQPVGGITYRIFHGREFAEIVFCAITSTEQVKGYGSHLMNHLKAYVRKTSDVQHFLTYADNYAVGYFKKQGFTADVTLDRSVWAGYIKDYEGGTIMQCTMVPKIDYLAVHETIVAQKKAISDRIQEAVNSSHTAYPGLQVFKEASVDHIDPYSIPGVAESGWYPDMGKAPADLNPLYPLLRQLITDLQSQSWSWPFKDPVDPEQVPGYYDVIKEPMGNFLNFLTFRFTYNGK